MATAKKSKTGYYKVTLHSRFEDGDITYLPKHDSITVDQDLYDRMDAASAISSFEPTSVEPA